MDEQLMVCLEQKVILLTKILDLTKQIEVRCKQSDIQLDNFLAQRSLFMERITKCDHLIANLIDRMPSDQQEHIRQLLKTATEERPCTADEKTILTLSKKCSSLKRRIVSIDSSARELLKANQDSIKEKLKSARANGQQQTLFHI